MACGHLLKNLFIYIKHRKRRVKDLLHHYEELKLEVGILLELWEDINNQIWPSATLEPNQQHKIWVEKIRWYKNRFQEIEQRYTVLCKDLESRVETEASENQSSSQNQTIRSTAGIDNQRSQEEAANEEGSNPPSNIRERKIWPREFFKLAALERDIVKLLPNVSAATKELVLGAVTRQKKPKIVEKMEAEELNTLPSHQKHLDNLRQLLKQENCKRIGICGSYGVGKTNIMKNLNNCFDSSSPSNCDFDYVIWVTVGNSEGRIIETMQAEIIGRLKLTPGTNRSRNSDIISTALSQKKYLLLLDDFSPSVNLEEFGIKQEQENGKVVLVATSFNPQIRKQLDLNEIIEVKRLSVPESRELFMKYIDHELTQAQKDMISPILEEVGWLPGPITLIARYLNTHQQEEYWEGLNQRLQSDVGTAEFVGLGSLEKWYRKAFEDLKGNDLKKCLLYAALFPNGHKIPRNTLVECWKAENFLKCDQPTLKAARSEGSIIFTQLEMSGLLESCCKKHVKMPVLFRKVALVLPFPEEGDGALCVRSGPNRDGHLKDKEWNNLRMLSMMGSKLKALPTSPKCSCISTLLLQGNPDLISIQNAFFTKMHKLRVLDLHGTGIASLPRSISNLKTLRSLYLNSCVSLKQLPTTIVQLTELEVLDIRHTLIPCSLDEISELVSLRCLRISFAADPYNLSGGQAKRSWIPFIFQTLLSNQAAWVIFPPMIHEKLSQLEELTIEHSREVTAQVVDRIKREVAGFEKRKGFQMIFKRYSGQAFDDEENCERLVGENNTSSGDHHGNNTVRKDKGKGIAIAEGNVKTRTQKPPGGIIITDPSETSPHELLSLKEENIRLKTEIFELQNKLSQLRRNRKMELTGLADGEGTSSLNAEASENQSSSQNQTIRSTAGIDNQKLQEEAANEDQITQEDQSHLPTF